MVTNSETTGQASQNICISSYQFGYTKRQKTLPISTKKTVKNNWFYECMNVSTMNDKGTTGHESPTLFAIFFNMNKLDSTCHNLAFSE